MSSLGLVHHLAQRTLTTRLHVGGAVSIPIPALFRQARRPQQHKQAGEDCLPL